MLLLLLLLSRFSLVWLCATPETAAHQAPPSPGFSSQEHWSGLPFPSPMHESEKWKGSRSVMPDSLRPHGLQPTRLLCPWDFPGKSTGVGWHISKVISLLFNMLSCSVIAFLPRSKSLLISRPQSPYAVILEVCHCFHCFPIYFSWSDGTGCHDLSFLNVQNIGIYN